MIEGNSDDNPMNDNLAVGNDSADKRPWKERRAEWERAYHREDMRKRRELARRERQERDRKGTSR